MAYHDHLDTELEALLEARARARGCALAIGERADGWIAAFEQDDPLGNRTILFSAEAGDRRRAVISLLRGIDLDEELESQGVPGFDRSSRSRFESIDRFRGDPR